MKKNITFERILILSLKTSFCFFIAFVLILSLPFFKLIKAYEDQTNKNYSESLILFEDVKIHIEKVSSPQDMQIGLSKYSYLSEDSGMFFIFENSDFHGIWMKDMKFPIDIIWLDQGLKIVHIEKNVSPKTYPKTFVPSKKAKYILEVNAGFADKNYLKVGNQGDLFLKP